MKQDWTENVPINIKTELKELDLSIGSIWGGIENPYAVATNPFIQKENKETINKLKELGWCKHEGRVIGGIKYVSFKKHF